MFAFFKNKKKYKVHKPDIAKLNDSCMECPNCHAIMGLPEYTPLTIGNCMKCSTPVFIPYFIKKYWLYLPLGGGGMGSVYRAFSADNPEKEFAVKILPRDKMDDPYLIASLLKEAEIGSHFGTHPYLIRIDGLGRFGEEYFSAMEFVEGERLDQLISAQDRVAHKYVLLWSLQMLSALQRIYDQGYLYRDMKPQNIMIDKSGNARLFDYGLCMSREQAAKENQSEAVEGSPLYMPPERIVGAGEGMASEIYSLGMVMFHAITGETYYSSTGAFELAKKHVTSLRFASVGRKMPAGVHPKLSALIDKMIARLPKDRYHSYREVGSEIQAIFNEVRD
jgi:serine/threonine-protein kinase